MNHEGERLLEYGRPLSPLRDDRQRWRLGNLLFPLVTSLILLIPTLLYWAHGRSVEADFQRSRVAQYRLRLARRIQTEVDSQLRPLRRLAGEIASGDVATPEKFASSARSVCREEPTLKYIAWVGWGGQCVSVFPSDAASKVFTELFGSDKPSQDQLFKTLAKSPDGMLLSFPIGNSARAADRLILLPIMGGPQIETTITSRARQMSHNGGPTVSGAIVTCETTQTMLGTLIPPDASAPFIVEVRDERGQPLFASDGATTAAKELLRAADVDQIQVLDRSWSMSVAAAPPGLGQRPAGDTDAFLLSGVVVAVLGGATVAQAGRHRRREQQRTREHLAALEALHAVAASISCKPRPEGEVLERLLAAACGLLHMSKAFVCQVESGKPTKMTRAVGFDPSLAGLQDGLEKLRIIQRCIQTGEMLSDENASCEPEGLNRNALHVLKIRTIFVFPLSAGEDRIGVMALCDEKPRRFSGEDFRLARLWASQAAVTLANQRLAAANDDALQQQQRLNQQVRRDADAKAMLLRELNHRVKNNLAGIVGLLSAGVPDLPEQAQEWLDRAIARIETLARAHELFLGTSNQRLTQIGLVDLVTKTLEPIVAIKPANVQIKLQLADVNDSLGTDQAITLAMVVNELASNALQHGVGDHGTLIIRASRPKSGWTMIEVIDDGTHAEEGVAHRGNGALATLPVKNQRTGIGLQLVRGLVGRELRGIFSMRDNVIGGTTATVEFPIAVSVAPTAASESPMSR